jgi:hypothetical protein
MAQPKNFSTCQKTVIKGTETSYLRKDRLGNRFSWVSTEQRSSRQKTRVRQIGVKDRSRLQLLKEENVNKNKR